MNSLHECIGDRAGILTRDGEASVFSRRLFALVGLAQLRGFALDFRNGAISFAWKSQGGLWISPEKRL
jgi:hypothetical protein